MPTDDSLQQAWQWLVPPVVEDSQGQLIPRRRVRMPSVQSPPQADLDFEENTSQAQDLQAEIAIHLMAQPGLLLAHPEASHDVQLQGRHVAYLLRRSARRSIGFSVSAQGLDVTAPQWVGMAEIESALQLLAGLGFVSSTPDPLGSTLAWQITAQGVLHVERH